MKRCCLLLLSLLLSPLPAALANPGAHGPNGEHLDAPAASVVGTDIRPRMETFSELFELVAHLNEHALTVMANHYASNEPVLSGELEVESGELKAKAAFDQESGAFVVADAALLKQLAQPGSHPLVFTLSSGEEIDLLAGELVVSDAQRQALAEHDHGHGAGRWWWGLLAAVVLAAVVVVLVRRRSRRA